MPARFVILQHDAPAGEHWDLMLERGETLLTWRLEREPFATPGRPIPARRIFSHPRAFLDYEGPLRGEQGRVRRVETGTVTFEEFTECRCIVLLRGVRLNGRFSLTGERDAWVFKRREVS